MKASGIVPAGIFILLSVFLFLETNKFPVRPGQDVGIAFWPRLLLILLLILSVVLIITTIKDSLNSHEDSTFVKWKGRIFKLLKPVLGMLSCVAFVFFFKELGFVISSFFIFIILAGITHEKLSLKKFSGIVIQAIVMVAVVYLLFGELLNVGLPQGIFFF